MINPVSTALLVIDMQNDFVAQGAPLEVLSARAVARTIQALLDHARRSGIKVIYSRHTRRAPAAVGKATPVGPPIRARPALAPGSPGVQIYSLVAPEANEPVIDKHQYSAFFETELDELLRTSGIDTVVITGVTTENCCHATARDALFRGYDVVFLSDATATFDYPDVGHGAMSASEIQQATLVILAFSTASVMTASEFMAKRPVIDG